MIDYYVFNRPELEQNKSGAVYLSKGLGCQKQKSKQCPSAVEFIVDATRKMYS